MKAMILAAGLGTRLRPITDEIPKALVPVQGAPLLELIIRKLMKAGVNEIVINVHHFADKIKSFLEDKNFFDVEINLSYEEKILGTGGGLLYAAELLTGNEPFFLHNVDILSDIDLQKMLQWHKRSNSLATLAVQKRKNTRLLLVDENQIVCGHENLNTNLLRLPRQPSGKLRKYGFCGIHVISPELFELKKFNGSESIIDIYLDLIGQGVRISSFEATKNYWKDIGKINSLEEVKSDFKAKKISLERLIG